MRKAVLLGGAIASALFLRGYAMTRDEAASRPTSTKPAGRVLLDYQSGTTGRAHCTVVDDPFGGGGKVIHGEVVEEGKNKTTFLNDGGFFVVPPAGQGEVVLRYAVRKEAKMRVALVAASGDLKSYYFEAPSFNTWCEAVLPLKELAPKVSAGEKIVDISVWQQAGGKDAGLWVDRITLRD